jgi:class 3 adenylate cyclase
MASGWTFEPGFMSADVEVRGQDIAGMSVTIAKRVCDFAGAGEVLVSGAVPPLVTAAGFAFDDRGEHELKGVPGSWKLFAVRD